MPPHDDHPRDGDGAPKERRPSVDGDAWRAEKGIVEEVAAIVASQLSMLAFTKDEFLSEAMSWIWNRRHRFDPARATFRSWCSTVLRNRGVDIIRRHARDHAMKRQKRYEAQLQQRVPEIPHDDRDPADMLEAHLEGLNRVLLAVEYRLLGRLAPDRCAAWLRHPDVPARFPWQAIEAIEDRASRRKALAAACERKYAWLNQRLYRAMLTIRQAEGVEAQVGDEGDAS